MAIFETLTIVFLISTLVLAFLLWGAREGLIIVYENLRHWFLKNKGYGWALLVQSNKNILRHYTKLTNEKISHNGKTYMIDPEAQLSLRGVPCYIYNQNDVEPVNITNKDASQEMKRNATFWDRFAQLIKVYEQIKANMNANITKMLIYISIGLGALACAMVGYLIYMLQQGGVVSI